jgi:hypothetical protein
VDCDRATRAQDVGLRPRDGCLDLGLVAGRHEVQANLPRAAAKLG